jgi:bacillithiol biosynthesis deacetylase BshB1
MALDLLVIAPHPDDAEIHFGAAIAAQVRLGHRVGILDATRGERASRGTPAQRAQEAAAAAGILGICLRDNLGLPDAGLSAGDLSQRNLIVSAIRRHAPRCVAAIHGHARHPDHQALAALVRSAVKLASLHAWDDDHPALPLVRTWYYEAELPLDRTPSLLIPCTENDWERKRAAIACYGSQLARPDGSGPATTISDPTFLRWIESRGRAWGFHAGSAYAEALVGDEPPRVGDLGTGA